MTGPHGGGAFIVLTLRHRPNLYQVDQISGCRSGLSLRPAVSSAAYRDGAGHTTYEINRNWSPEKNQLMQIGRQHVGLFSGAPFTLEHLPQDQIRAPFLDQVIAVL